LIKKFLYVIHAVQGKPPSIATGRVGAVGQIHFICIMSYHIVRNTPKVSQLSTGILAQKR